MLGAFLFMWYIVLYNRTYVSSLKRQISMTKQQNFGGTWTEDKLQRLKGYLEAYMVILKKYSYLQPVYVDAFAGTGGRRTSSLSATSATEQNEPTPDAMQEVLKGSARIALEVEPPFHQYIFIERSRHKCKELQDMASQYPDRTTKVRVEKGDASTVLTDWCQHTNWKITRAVVFLDPFGMQVEWSLLETLAQTKAIDLWLLVPLGMGVNRLMTQEDLPPEEWANKLTRFLGNDEWKTRFYRSRIQPDLFNESSPVEKNVDHQALAGYFISRLKDIFPGVAENPLAQRNSRNSPMFLLCFATANPKSTTIKAALNIAQHLLKEN